MADAFMGNGENGKYNLVTTSSRNAWRADGERQLDNSGGKRLGKRVEAGGAGVPPATIPESENRPETTCFP
jgi:hypothetical protein